MTTPRDLIIAAILDAARNLIPRGFEAYHKEFHYVVGYQCGDTVVFKSKDHAEYLSFCFGLSKLDPE